MEVIDLEYVFQHYSIPNCFAFQNSSSRSRKRGKRQRRVDRSNFRNTRITRIVKESAASNFLDDRSNSPRLLRVAGARRRERERCSSRDREPGKLQTTNLGTNKYASLRISRVPLFSGKLSSALNAPSLSLSLSFSPMNTSRETNLPTPIRGSKGRKEGRKEGRRVWSPPEIVGELG